MKNWHDLLASPDGTEVKPRRFSIVRKKGQSFLYLPADDRIAADTTLRLYPAQTLFARTMVRIASWFIRSGFLPFSERITIPVSQHTALGAFFKGLIPESHDVPRFGILGGNLKTPGRRLIFLLFDTNHQPRVVVKVGISPKARELIQIEQDFFFQQHPQFEGLPEALAQYKGVDACAIAYRYVEGAPPLHHQRGGIETLLNSWISDSEPVPLTDLPIWKELEVLRQENPGLEPVFQALQETRIRPVLCHGDFAPWNIRVPPSAKEGNWVVMDWERGCLNGLPAWDWLHYTIQYNAMVRHMPPEEILSDLNTLWENPAFLSYARRTGIEKITRELTLLYFLYLLRYFAPRDNIPAIHLLMEKFRERYFKDIALSRPRLKISVVTPSYKQLPWLKLCIASVADQKGVTVEHIIQDAQSGRDLEEWVRRHSQARLFVEADAGMYDAINRGWKKATGDILCWLNCDEQYLPGTLEEVAAYFQAHPEVDVLFADTVVVDADGKYMCSRQVQVPLLYHTWTGSLQTLSSSMFFRSSFLKNEGFWMDTGWKDLGDKELMLRMLRAHVHMGILRKYISIFVDTGDNRNLKPLARQERRDLIDQAPLWVQALSPLWMLAHRLRRMIHGLYWPKAFDYDIYTQASPRQRIHFKVSHPTFFWKTRMFKKRKALALPSSHFDEKSPDDKPVADAGLITFSIVTPSYKQPEWLRLCAASVADQSAPGIAIEHIVQDSVSGPEVAEAVKPFPQLKLVSEKDNGMYDAINRGWEKATGDVLCWLNCDEQYLPGTLKEVADYFRAHPEVDVLFADTIIVDNDGKYLCSRPVLTPQLYHTWTCHLQTFSCSTFFRRSILKERGFSLDPRWKDLGDAELTIRMLNAGVHMDVLRRYTTSFVDNGENRNLKPVARQEREILTKEAPPWAQHLRFVWILGHRLRRLWRGIYSYSFKPFAYEIYTQSSPQQRIHFEVAHPTFYWTARMK